MATVTITDLREHIETDLVDAALTRLLDDAVAEVEERFGDDTAKTVVLDGAGERFLKLHRPASAITSVTENTMDRANAVTLDATDYVLRHGGRLLERLPAGTNGSAWGGWAPVVTVVYTPVPEEDRRNRVIIDLVKLEISYNGMVKNEQVGDYDSEGDLNADAYTREREQLLKGIANSRGFRFA